MDELIRKVTENKGSDALCHIYPYPKVMMNLFVLSGNRLNHMVQHRIEQEALADRLFNLDGWIAGGLEPWTN